MTKTIFKFWITNILVSIALFIIYRVVISETTQNEKGFFETILFILRIFLNLGFSIVYLIVMIICSFAIYLNLVKTIRQRLYASLLTFIGLPFAGLIYLIISSLIDFNSIEESLLENFIIFTAIYLVFTAIQFFFFRKTVQGYKIGETV